MLGDREHGAIAKDEVNKLREKLTASAVSKIDAMDQSAIRQKITDFQLKTKHERDIESMGKKMKAAVRQSRTHKGEYHLR